MSERIAFIADGPASVDAAVRAIGPKLELELVEMPAESGASRAFDDVEGALHLAAQALGAVEALGLARVLVASDAVTLHLRRSARLLAADDALRARVNGQLARIGAPPTTGAVEVRHLVWELASERGLALVREHCVRPLEELRVAPLHGCQLLRPSRELGIDDPGAPASLGRVLTACGAVEVPLRSSTSCCGAAVAQTRPEIALGAAAVPHEQALDAEADVLVASSSRCYAMLSERREQISRQADRDLTIPVLHVAQLVALAFGLTRGVLQLDRATLASRAIVDRLALPVG